MKNFLPLFAFLVVATTSCRQYQYITINSNNLKQEDKAGRDFVIENDSLQIVYNFKGKDAPVNIRITNKLDRPIAIDWKRSALIVNDQAVSYMPDKLITTGTASGSTLNWSKDWSTSYTSFSATTPLPVDWQMIPPKSFIVRTPMGVTNTFFKDKEKSSFVKTQKILSDGTPVYVREASFTEETSPLKFRSYLTVLTEGDGRIDPIVFEHSFYASKFTNSTMSPTGLSMEEAYVKRSTAFGTGFGVVAGVAVLGTVMAMNAQTSGK
ncbi:MAG: hypothetical protein J7578_05370 [Chitinophagaceae bacterium]|nr:hypothetical protein [Chitinophagaceae bacterium]